MSQEPVRTLRLPAASEVLVFPDSGLACRDAAGRIARVIRELPSPKLGLATGSTPIRVYAELVALHRAGTLSFGHVHCFNLDEYYPISPLNSESYRWFMNHHLFGHVDIPPNQAHVLDGTVPAEAAPEHAAQFERWIESAGGLDLQLLGIGRNGHIGFNEPEKLELVRAVDLPTRQIELHPVTRSDAALAFGGLDHVPTHALTVGTRQILKSKRILILAFGANKAEAVAGSLQGPPTSNVPASLLRTVADRVVWLLDEDSAAGIESH